MADPTRVGPTGWPDVTETLFPAVEAWCRRYLRQPDGPDAGSPWTFTDEQARFVAWWYALDDDDRWVYRRGTLRRVKGWGKDPLGAVLALVEFAGPCRFGGRRRDGTPIAIPHTSPWVQVYAVSRDQTRTTMRLFGPLLSKRARDDYGIEVHRTVVYGSGGRTIEAITSAPTSSEGPRTTFVLRNEVQNWLSNNEGHEMAEVIDGNLAKSRDGSARALSICNAHRPGEDSVGEREWDAYQAIEQGRTRLRDVLYDSLEAPADTKLDDEESLRRGLTVARGDSTWLDLDRHVAEIWDPRTTPSEARRKYLNQVVAAEDAWIEPYRWKALGDPAPAPLVEGELVTLGFDGSKSDDHSALIATRIDDGAWITLEVWDPAKYGGEIPRDLVDTAVRTAHDRFDVVAFYSDLEGWETYVDRWAADFGRSYAVKASVKHAIAWDMRTRTKEFTLEGVERLFDEIVEGAFRHDGDRRVAEHVANARRRPNAWGVSFGKEHRESKRKVDALAAGTLSRMARRVYLALPKSKQRRRVTGEVVLV